MARCEDFPCCGHEAGCCPDFDGSGKQLNMKCTCGATVPLGSKSSICDACLRLAQIEDGDFPEEDYDEELARDQILERQELEDFEQADEYFGHYDGGYYDE